MIELGLKDKKAIVTGSTRGIGRAIAVTLAECGANVFINGRDPKRVENTIEDLKNRGLAVTGFAGDVSHTEVAQRFVKTVFDSWGGIDILVNNAGGSYPSGMIETITEEFWNKNIDVNLKSAFLMCREVAPFMKKQKAGKIINITSLSGIQGLIGAAAYAAAKSGLIGLTKSLAKELGGFGITVNAIAPGLVKTDLTQNLYTGELERVFEKTCSYTPLGRLCTPQDVANAVLFLSSSFTNFITGEVLVIDGGFSLLGRDV